MDSTFLRGNLKRRDVLGDLDADGRITLICIVKK
jgi:hypothetical protein